MNTLRYTAIPKVDEQLIPTITIPSYPIPKLVDYVSMQRIYGLQRSTFSKLVMLNKFVPVVKIGNKNYFKTVDVEAWIEKQTQPMEVL